MGDNTRGYLQALEYSKVRLCAQVNFFFAPTRPFMGMAALGRVRGDMAPAGLDRYNLLHQAVEPLPCIAVLHITGNGARWMEANMDGIALMVFEVWSPDGNVYKTTLYVTSRDEANRLAYLLDGVPEFQCVVVARPE